MAGSERGTSIAIAIPIPIAIAITHPLPVVITRFVGPQGPGELRMTTPCQKLIPDLILVSLLRRTWKIGRCPKYSQLFEVALLPTDRRRDEAY